MKKLILASALALAVSGCGSVNGAFVRGVDEYAVRSGLLDEYEKYVESDPKLKEESKKIRKDTSSGLKKLIEEAKKQSGE